MSYALAVYPNTDKSCEILSYHNFADSTHPYNAFFNLTMHVPLSLTYFIYDLSIDVKTPVKYLFNLINTVWLPSSGISLFENAPGKSIVANDLFSFVAIEATINTLVVLTVGDEPLS